MVSLKIAVANKNQPINKSTNVMLRVLGRFAILTNFGHSSNQKGDSSPAGDKLGRNLQVCRLQVGEDPAVCDHSLPISTSSSNATNETFSGIHDTNLRPRRFQSAMSGGISSDKTDMPMPSVLDCKVGNSP